jgi:hypothetical protein
MTNYIPTPASTLNPGWTGRNEALAKFIHNGSSILDLGCGSRDILRYVTTSAYCGIDYFDNEFADIQLDLNTDFNLPEGKWDYILCSGLLEYLEDVSHFFFRIKHKANSYVFTYWQNATAQGSGIVNERAPKNVVDFEEILSEHFIIEKQDCWKSHNIYVCSMKNEGKNVNLYWYGGKKSSGNCGDIIGPYLLEKYGYTCLLAPHNGADVYCVGSIAESVRAGATVLGSGIIKSNSVLSPDAHWKWVRGPLTRKRLLECGGTCPEIYGDAALLMPRMFKGSSVKRHSFGIVSHYVDFETITKRYPNAHIINMMTNDLEQTVREITECEKIISSSLHGIIIANAYDIPAAWTKFNPLFGDDVKFQDYALSVGCELHPSTVEDPLFIHPSVNVSELHKLLSTSVTL